MAQNRYLEVLREISVDFERIKDALEIIEVSRELAITEYDDSDVTVEQTLRRIYILLGMCLLSVEPHVDSINVLLRKELKISKDV